MNAIPDMAAQMPIHRSKTRKLMTSRMALHSATHAVHQRLHKHPGLARLATGTIGRDEYRRLLGRSYGFYAMAEPALGFSGRFTDCLARDLIDLGMTYEAISGLPRCPLLRIDEGDEGRIGAHYVLLGASLGGTVMAKAIARRDATLPLRFLTCRGDHDWNEFSANLEFYLPDAGSRARAAKAANMTFAAYEDWMDGHE